MCVVLIIAYASVVFLPHSHENAETDCVACVLIESSKKLLMGIALLTGIYRIINCEFVIFDLHFRIISAREISPVGLKVKLSD